MFIILTLGKKDRKEDNKQVFDNDLITVIDTLFIIIKFICGELPSQEKGGEKRGGGDHQEFFLELNKIIQLFSVIYIHECVCVCLCTVATGLLCTVRRGLKA